MVPLGYMAKIVVGRPTSIVNPIVTEICSVSSCISNDFMKWIDCWKHNGYWLFDSPAVIRSVAKTHNVDLKKPQLFYYEGFELEFHVGTGWRSYFPEPNFHLAVVAPKTKVLRGFDLVTYTCGSSAECSPLSCNGLADQVRVNEYCLCTSFEEAKDIVHSKMIEKCEPGPYRVVAVYSVNWD